MDKKAILNKPFYLILSVSMMMLFAINPLSLIYDLRPEFPTVTIAGKELVFYKTSVKELLDDGFNLYLSPKN